MIYIYIYYEDMGRILSWLIHDYPFFRGGINMKMVVRMLPSSSPEHDRTHHEGEEQREGMLNWTALYVYTLIL